MDASKDDSFQWRLVAASICGRSHEKLGQLCQDAHYWATLPGGILVAAVADGAGSAALGKVGAIVAAQTAVETICSNQVTLQSSEDEEGWQLLLTDALVAAKTAVEAEAVACNATIRDLSTTLIVTIAAPNLVAAAQIGDGVAVLGDRQGNLIALTTPKRGEYANETTFLVSPHALDTAQVTLWRGAAANIAVLSDGLQMLALEMNEGTPHAPFFSPLFHFLADVTNEAEAKEQIVALLRSERIAKLTDDDLTLLLATLVS
ncbi:MAG: protein phosphatase 2C domain-containing protein [Chroococcidiopsidaceae cyanobacterium CP_BM_RX_35]|nr:protein phosphatase 2C domain-containing protein [Chroococcidiopsidaceae cyanobacterium CP_BM_RX_35]